MSLVRWWAVVMAIVIATPITTAARNSAGATVERRHDFAPGVAYTELRRPNLVAHVTRIAPDSGFTLRPVLAHDRVEGGGRQATSELCRRAGGVVCVNGDFAACPLCREPFGGVVVDGRVLRTPHHAHEQVTFTERGPTSAPLAWGGRLVAEHVWRSPLTGPVVGGADGQGMELRRERHIVPLAGLNVDPVGGGAVLYTPEWGPTTPSPSGHLEVVLATAGPVAPGAVGAEVGGQRDGGGPVPAGGAVVSANGEAAARLQALADAWRRSDATEKVLIVETALTLPALHSVGGHPVLLRDGHRQSWWQGDAKARGRHPRTLVGWSASGEVILVVADGRAPGHSDGLTLEEAADLLVSLGASDGVNLDGGGSSTFVGRCAAGPCVLNRPSDGRERLLPVALALVGAAASAQPIAPPAAPPLAPPAPPPPDDPASTAHVPEPEVAAAEAGTQPSTESVADDPDPESVAALTAPAAVRRGVVPDDRERSAPAGPLARRPAPGDNAPSRSDGTTALVVAALAAGVAAAALRRYLHQR